jgi:hypothetical protein
MVSRAAGGIPLDPGWRGTPGREGRGEPVARGLIRGRRDLACLAVALGVLAASLAGCSTLIDAGAGPRIAAPPILPTATELQARLAAERQRVRSLRALADSDVSGPEGRFRASEILLVAPPERLRIEVLSTFGVAWILATNGETLDVYSRQDETVYRGRPTPGVVDHYLPVPLALAELTELLLGRPPPRPVLHSEGVAWEPETGLVRLRVLLQNRGRQTIWFDGRTGWLTRCEERNANDVLRYDMRVTGYREVDGALVVTGLTIVTPAGVQVRLAYANYELNPDLPSTLFQIPFVVGARETRIEGLEASEAFGAPEAPGP